MSEVEVPSTAEDQEKLKKIIAKDSKTGRTMSGFWLWLSAGMGIFMVLFYMFCAARPVDTQYFLGLYVMLTYTMVFIKYPMTPNGPDKPGYYVDSVISFLSIFFAVYYALHFLLGAQGAKEAFEGINLLYAVVGVAVAGCFFLPIRHWGKSEGHAPIAMDIMLALVSVFAVGYYIMEYAAINYRMGSEIPLDTAVSVLGILISLEVARRVLGWSMTIVGLLFLAYAFWGDLLHPQSHRVSRRLSCLLPI